VPDNLFNLLFGKKYLAGYGMPTNSFIL